MKPELPKIERSNALYERAKRRIPAGTQTLAKGVTQHVNGVMPKFLERGEGAYVWDVDGNRYLDCNMAIGPVSLGYTYPEVDEAVEKQLRSGMSFSLVHPLEVEVAELVCDVVPGAERVRFSKTGADVVSAAVRLARAHTGRAKVLCCGYHGWHDWYIGTTSRSFGVPEGVQQLTRLFPYNDLAALDEALSDDVACVVMEPMTFEIPGEGYLQGVADLCKKRGALLVFDEMWTGFRVALGGAQQRFGVTADMACFSKAVANGMPISMLTGRADVLDLADQTIFFFTTFGGEALSLAAAKATIDVMQRDNVAGHLERMGELLIQRVERLLERLELDYLGIQGLPCRTMLSIKEANGADALLIKSLIQQELVRHGILWGGSHALSYSHKEEQLEELLSAYEHVLPDVAQIVAGGKVREALQGEPVQPVFRKTSFSASKSK